MTAGFAIVIWIRFSDVLTNAANVLGYGRG
jgi:hypothetical protein